MESAPDFPLALTKVCIEISYCYVCTVECEVDTFIVS